MDPNRGGPKAHGKTGGSAPSRSPASVASCVRSWPARVANWMPSVRFLRERSKAGAAGAIVFARTHIPVTFHPAAKDQMDMRRLPMVDDTTFTIEACVPAATIDFIYADKPYYAASDARHIGAYALLRDALARTKRVAVGTIDPRASRAVVLQPVGAVLVLTWLRSPEEIYSLEDLGLPRIGAGWTWHEMDRAVRSIEALAEDWRPKRHAS